MAVLRHFRGQGHVQGLEALRTAALRLRRFARMVSAKRSSRACRSLSLCSLAVFGAGFLGAVIGLA